MSSIELIALFQFKYSNKYKKGYKNSAIVSMLLENQPSSQSMAIKRMTTNMCVWAYLNLHFRQSTLKQTLFSVC